MKSAKAWGKKARQDPRAGLQLNTGRNHWDKRGKGVHAREVRAMQAKEKWKSGSEKKTAKGWASTHERHYW